jgi:hypothetical protein
MYTDDIIHAYFFFVDIVSSSDPELVIKKQVKKIEALNSLIASCEVYKSADPSSIIYLPTGDGMVIGFTHGPQLPLELAVELHKKLHSYNKGRFAEEALRIRIGINDGAAFVVKDLKDNPNYWGPGIVYARRVMDIGDDGHILVSKHTAETLRNLADRYKKLLHSIGDYYIKHDEVMSLYSAYEKGGIVGNPKKPKTNAVVAPPDPIKPLQIKYAKNDVALAIKDPVTMLTRHKRSHNVDVISDEPVKAIMLAIGTDVEKSFEGLNIRVYDESGNDLKIVKINMDKPHNKQFTIQFYKPIHKGEKNRGYTLEYEVEEPEKFFENFFAVDCKKFSLSFMYPSGNGFRPAVYDVDADTEKKKPLKIKPAVTEQENGFVKTTWTRTNMLEGQCIRLEW